MTDSFQDARSIAVSSDFLPDGCIFKQLDMTEELGRLFSGEIEILSTSYSASFDDALGKNITVRLELPDDETRFFNGFVTRFTLAGADGDYIRYRATLKPWLWFLTRTADCRIFQEKTASDIILEVFRDHGFTDFDDRLSGTYRTREFCVQYRETDFDFVSRLMEEEGIYYYFKHEDGKHTLVLADGASSHDVISGYDEVPYYPPEASLRRERDHISSWVPAREIQPGAYAYRDFDFKNTKADLTAQSAASRSHEHATFEIFDYPGGYVTSDEGRSYATNRLEELQAKHARSNAAGNARGITSGGLFALTNFPRDDENQEYLIISGRHSLVAEEYESGGGGATGHYSNEFSTQPSSEPFRTSSVTPKPIVKGPQTAIVVGKSGEEIWTDEFGRVKVQFHWDRHGSYDEVSSCWIRVAQISAGKGWGGMFIPRIGQEVIVEFLEGDPDRPIITGRVYNGQSTVPYELPTNATRSTIKTNSSKGGGGFNEIRFEDKKDDEQIFIHSQKNTDVWTGSDHKEQIGNDHHITITNDQFDHVKNNKHSLVVGDECEQVDGDKNSTFSANRKISVGENDHLDIATDWNVAAGGDTNLDSGGDHNHAVSGKFSVDASDVHQKGSSNVAFEGGQNVHIKGGMNVVIEAGIGLTLKVGGNFVAIGPAGVDIQGTMVKINSGGAAGSGSGCSPGSPVAPEAPDEPEEAVLPEEGAAGEVDEPSSGSPIEHEASELSSQAVTLRAARNNESAFCEECAAAASR